ncbi:PAS domain S-box protein [bacterium]|nr:PAS domain S-box protein [bacterium]
MMTDDSIYRELFELSQNAILLLDPVLGRYMDCNPAALHLFGVRSKEEFLKSGPVALSPDIQPDGSKSSVKAIELIAIALEQGVYSWEWIHKKNNGECFPVLVQATKFEMKGQVLLMGVIQDITLRKEAEKKLALFKYALESASDAIGMSTPDGRHYYQNRAFDEMFGDISADPPGSVYVSEECGRDVFNTIMSGNRWVGEVEMFGEGGDIFNVFLRAYAIKDNTGEILGLVGVHTDITTRKKAEATLKDSEERFRLMSLLISDLIYEWDLKTDHLEWFGGIDERLGFEKGEISSDITAWLGLIHPEDMERLGNAVEYHRTTGEDIDIRYRIQTKDGHYRYWWDKGIAIFGDEGRPIRLIGACTDITEQVEAEKTLVFKENIIESASSAIVTSTLDGRITSFNPAFKQIWKIGKKDKVLGEHFSTFWMTEDILEIITEALQTIGKWYGVIKARRPDGSMFDVQVAAATVYDKDGNPVSLMSSSVDITERKQAETKLKKSEERFRLLTNNLPSVMIYQVLVMSDLKRQFTYVSDTVRTLNEVTPEEVLADKDKLYGQVLPEYMPELIRREEQAIKKMHIFRCEVKMRMPSGKIKWFELASVPHRQADGSIVFDGVEIDITERICMQEMMIQSEKMLSVGGLAAGMAHEINNPLAGMMQSSQVLLNRLTGKLPANVKAAIESGTDMDTIKAYMEKRDIINQLKNIHESGTRAAKIVDNMLSFARKSESTAHSVQIPALLDKTVELAANDYNLINKFDFKQINIIRNYETNLSAVPCEATKIQQVLLNILKNGAEAMNCFQLKLPEKSRKSYYPEFILRIASERDMIRIEIEDNGVGMDEKKRKRIFEPFFTTKPVGEGTGLGLSVSYFIITENHNGTMKVESTEDGGTCFIIRLPFEVE